jgi:hypothetical protein
MRKKALEIKVENNPADNSPEEIIIGLWNAAFIVQFLLVDTTVRCYCERLEAPASIFRARQKTPWISTDKKSSGALLQLQNRQDISLPSIVSI